jgi:tetratricopeptide (TPR) repeat protein
MENTTIATSAEFGRLAYEAGNYAAAAEMFLKAEQVSKASGDNLQAAEMANNRSVALLQAGDAQAAYDACAGTDTIFANAGDTRREGLALGNLAAALKELGRREESLKYYHLSADRLKKAGDKENLAIVHKTISAIEMEKGDNLGAMSAMLDALQVKEKLTLRERFMRWLFSVASRLMPH